MADPVELAAVAEQAGLNAGDVLRWYSQSDVQSNPEYKAMPANKVVQKYMQGVQALTQVKETGKLDLNALLQPQGRLPTTVNPYKGTTQEAANPQAPNASSISQFDPAAVKAAQDEYNRKFNAGQPYRDVANMVAAAGSGWGSGKAGEHVAGVQKMYQEQLADQTIGAQKRQMDAATAAQAALTSAQAREESAGKYAGTQQEQQQKLDIGILNAQAQKDLSDPKSPQTMLAKQIILDQLAASQVPITPQLKQMLSGPNITALQLMGFMEPKVLEAFKTKVGINKTIEETAMNRVERQNLETQGEGYRQQQGLPKPNYSLPEGTIRFGQPSGASNAPPNDLRNQMQVDPKDQRTRDNIRLGMLMEEWRKNKPKGEDAASLKREIESTAKKIGVPTPDLAQTPKFDKLKGAMSNPDNMDPTYIANAKESDLSPIQKLERQRLESTDNAEIIRLEKEIANQRGTPYIKPGSGPQTITMPSGKGFSTSQSPVSSAAQERTGKSIQSKADSVDVFNSSGRPAAQNAIRLADEAGYNKLRNFAPLTNEDADRLQKYVDRLNAEATRLGTVVGQGPNPAAGAVAGALGGIHPLLGASAGAFAALADQKQPITNKTPPEVIKQFGYATQLAAERQKALIAKENAWSARHSGDTSGFVTSDDYKFIMNAEPYVNPATGDLILPLSRSQQDQLLRKGYGPLKDVNFSSFKPKGK